MTFLSGNKLSMERSPCQGRRESLSSFTEKPKTTLKPALYWLKVPSKEAMDKFFENAGEEVAKSGHILESTEVTMLTN